MARTLNKLTKQAQPLTLEILTDILGYLNLQRTKDRVFWAILLVGFFGMLRKSNLIPDQVSDFDPNKQLTRAHIPFRDRVAIINVTWVKNIQFRQKVLEIPLFEIPNSPLCPVTALRSILCWRGKSSDPLFARHGKVTFTYSQFHKKFRSMLKKAGYRHKAFSSHSMRRRAANLAHRSGVPDDLIKIHGGWSSDCFKRYLDYPIEIRALVSLKMQKKVLDRGF